MEIAVILAAGLRDWIDFGVIVSAARASTLDSRLRLVLTRPFLPPQIAILLLVSKGPTYMAVRTVFDRETSPYHNPRTPSSDGTKRRLLETSLPNSRRTSHSRQRLYETDRSTKSRLATWFLETLSSSR